MKYLVPVMLVVAGIIHLLPLAGVLSSGRLASLYGVSFDDANLEILMRHRAVLFGLLGTFLLYAAFKPACRSFACVGGIISAAAFLWLAGSVGGYNEQLGRVVSADIVALACLVIAAIAHVLERRAAGQR